MSLQKFWSKMSSTLTSTITTPSPNSNGKKKTKFQLPLSNNEDEEDEQRPTPKKGSTKTKRLQGKTWPSSISMKSNGDVVGIQQDEKVKLIQYLNTEQPIVKKRFEPDSSEIMLCDELSGQVIELDKYLKMPEPKAKDKLWRIPYHFKENQEGGSSGPISRFGEGVKDGCNVLLSLPSVKPARRCKDWSELLFEADDALKLFENAKWSRRTQTRRGSILQPRNIFLTPNPSVQCGDTIHTNGFRLPMREWTSELNLEGEVAKCGGDYLDQGFRYQICENHSLCDLGLMHLPVLKPNQLSSDSSELHYLQTVRSRRRQSLVPPSFVRQQTDLKFRRQSYGNGEQLWSAKVENLKKRDNYHNKIKLICPGFVSVPRLTSLGPESATNNSDDSDIDIFAEYPDFDYRSSEQPVLFANELTLIARHHFISIKESEIVHFMTRPGPNVLNSCSNIKSLLHFRVRLIRLIATYVLREVDCDSRAQSILFFLRVIRELYRLSNWNSVNLIIQSLQCPPVVRLKETWRRLTFKYPQDFCYFIKISEDLERKQQLRRYEMVQRCVPIFDDLIDAIKERCGFKMVQILQHRLHHNWSELNRDDNYVMWVSNEITELIQDIEQQQMVEPSPLKKHQKPMDKVQHNGTNHNHKKSSTKSNGTTVVVKQQKSCLKKSSPDLDQSDQPKKVKTKQISFEVEDDEDEDEDLEAKDLEENLQQPKKSKTKLFHRLFHCPNITRSSSKKSFKPQSAPSGNSKSSLKKSKQDYNNNDNYHPVSVMPVPNGNVNEDNNDDYDDEEEEEENDNDLTVDLNQVSQFRQQQRGLVSRQFDHPAVNPVKTPSCVRFWSITELNKLRPEDREQVKQEMVRTLVSFQKKAFYVFEERDPVIRHFLLDANCHTMDASMERSRLIEYHHSRMSIQKNLNNNDNASLNGSEDVEEEEADEEVETNDVDQESLSIAKRYLANHGKQHRQSIIVIDPDNEIDCDKISTESNVENETIDQKSEVSSIDTDQQFEQNLIQKNDVPHSGSNSKHVMFAAN